MDKITGAKTEFRLKQWTHIIQTCQASGMTVVNWCEQNNVKTKSYYYWLRKKSSKTLAIVNVNIKGTKNEHILDTTNELKH